MQEMAGHIVLYHHKFPYLKSLRGCGTPDLRASEVSSWGDGTKCKQSPATGIKLRKKLRQQEG